MTEKKDSMGTACSECGAILVVPDDHVPFVCGRCLKTRGIEADRDALRAEVERLRHEVESPVNARVSYQQARAEVAEADRDAARAEVERLREALVNIRDRHGEHMDGDRMCYDPQAVARAALASAPPAKADRPEDSCIGDQGCRDRRSADPRHHDEDCPMGSPPAKAREVDPCPGCGERHGWQHNQGTRRDECRSCGTPMDAKPSQLDGERAAWQGLPAKDREWLTQQVESMLQHGFAQWEQGRKTAIRAAVSLLRVAAAKP